MVHNTRLWLACCRKGDITVHSPGIACQTSPGCWLSRWRRRWHGAPAFLCRTPLPAATAGRAAQIWTPGTGRRKFKSWDWMNRLPLSYVYRSDGINKNILTGRNCSVRNSKSSTGDSELSKKYILINGLSSFCISWDWQSVCALRCSKATQHKGNDVTDFSYKNKLLQPPPITQRRIFSFNVVAVSIRTYSGGKRKD